MYNYTLQNSREKEFPNLNGVTYVDHIGTTLYAKSQMEAVHKDLNSNLYGNPHSHHHSSRLATDSVDQIRYRLLRFFNASPEEYSLIFTSGCTAAVKLVADTFDFKYRGENTQENQAQGSFCFLQDNHTSVQGMRGHLCAQGVRCVCLDTDEIEACIRNRPNNSTSIASTTSTNRNTDTSSSSTTTTTSVPSSSSSTASPMNTTSSLFAYPAQSNFSGQRYPLSWIKSIQSNGLSLEGHNDNPSPNLANQNQATTPTRWYVLLDAASYVSTSPLPLDEIKPDFVTVSFYKIFGYPTGVGALLVHRRAAHLMTKGFFGGGTVAASTSREPWQIFRKSLHERFEDGTLPFLSIISLRHGLDAVQLLAGGMQGVSQHVYCIASYFYTHLTQLQHGNGNPLACVYGEKIRYENLRDQGGIVTFNLQRSDGRWIGYAEVDKFAHLHDVHLRTGCFCNIGACQKYLGLSSKTIRDNFAAGHVCGDNVDLVEGSPTGAIRISFGYMSTLDDARACLRFISHTFLEDVTTLPRFPYPDWWDHEQVKGHTDGPSSVKVRSNADDDNGTLLKRHNNDIGGVEKQAIPGVMSDGGGIVGKMSSHPSPATHITSLTGSVVGVGSNATDGGFDGSVGGVRRVVTDIFLYPLKSCGAFRAIQWPMGTRGLLYDREWVLVSDSGVTLGQRREPKMCLIQPEINLATKTLTLHYPGRSPFQLPLDQEQHTSTTSESSNSNTTANSALTLCTSKVCGDRVNTFDCGDEVAEWLSDALIRPGIRLVRQLNQDTRISKQVDKVELMADTNTKSNSESNPEPQRLSLANESQMLLLNRASVRALQSKMAEMGGDEDEEGGEGELKKENSVVEIPTKPSDVSEDNMVLRFRGNLVVDGGNPFEEEEWGVIGVGSNKVACQNVCSRCSMICMDQTRGLRSREPLRTLAAWRGKKVPFGVHSRMIPLPDGARQYINVGDTITVL